VTVRGPASRLYPAVGPIFPHLGRPRRSHWRSTFLRHGPVPREDPVYPDPEAVSHIAKVSNGILLCIHGLSAKVHQEHNPIATNVGQRESYDEGGVINSQSHPFGQGLPFPIRIL